MGCNCGGARRAQAAAQAARRDSASKTPPKRAGGPGDPGYYWSGPKRPPKPTN